MKKVILSAAIAAIMSVPAFADISIKGDAHYRYSNIEDAVPLGRLDGNLSAQRVRLHVTGRKGDTTVKLGLRNDGGTRVSKGVRGASDSLTGSPRGIASGDAIFAVDYLFLTTKIGAIKIKAGDWWHTTGVGLVRKGVPITEGIAISTKVGDINFGVKGVAGSDIFFYTVSGKVSGFKVVAQTSDGVGGDTDDYVDLLIKGKVSGVGVAAEIWSGDTSDAHVVHFWKTINGITWHIAQASWDRIDTADNDNAWNGNSKFSPLGVSILGTAPGVNGRTALGNVNNGNRAVDTDVVGVRADLKVAGMGVQVTAGNLDLGEGVGDGDKTFKDIIVTRALGKGSNIKASYGTFAGATSLGAQISVKF